MKNKYKLFCIAITLVAIISLACVPAMAYQLGTVIADSDNDGQDVEPTDSYESFESEVISSEPVSDASDTSDIFDDTESDYMDDPSSEYESESSEPVESIFDDEPSYPSDEPSSSVAESQSTSSSSYEYSYTSSYSNGINYEMPYTSLFTTSEDDTRSVMTSKNWSDIALEDSDGKTVANINIKDGTGDFNFIKENKSKNNSSVYYWLAGGIACIIIGLSGIAIVIVLSRENKKKALAMAKSRGSASKAIANKGSVNRRGGRTQRASKYDTAEFDLPDRYDDGF